MTTTACVAHCVSRNGPRARLHVRSVHGALRWSIPSAKAVPQHCTALTATIPLTHQNRRRDVYVLAMLSVCLFVLLGYSVFAFYWARLSASAQRSFDSKVSLSVMILVVGAFSWSSGAYWQYRRQTRPTGQYGELLFKADSAIAVACNRRVVPEADSLHGDALSKEIRTQTMCVRVIDRSDLEPSWDKLRKKYRAMIGEQP